MSKGYQEAVSMLNLRRGSRNRETSNAHSRVKGIPGSSLDAKPEEEEERKRRIRHFPMSK